MFKIVLLSTAILIAGCATPTIESPSSPGTPKEVRNPASTMNREMPKVEPFTDKIKKSFSVVATTGAGREMNNVTYTFGVGKRGSYMVHCTGSVFTSKTTMVLARIAYDDSYVDVATYRPISKVETQTWDQCMNNRKLIVEATKKNPVTVDVRSASDFALITDAGPAPEIK